MKSIEQKKIGEPSPEAIDFAKRMIALKWTKETNVDTIASCWQAGYLFGQIDSGSKYGRDWTSVTESLPDCHRIDGDKKKVNWVLGSDGGNTFVCVYTKGHELEYGDEDPSDEEYDEVEANAGCLCLKPGWYELEETPRGEYDETWIRRKPTHWQPLPLSPKS